MSATAGAQLSNKATLPEISTRGPSMAYLGVLYLGWTSPGNNRLYLTFFSDGHMSLGILTSNELSTDSPVLCVHNDALYIAWTGTDGRLNVGAVKLQGNGVTGISNKVTLNETSERSPSLVSLDGRLYLAWRGVGNQFLNVMSSADNGRTFTNKYTATTETSPDSPTLCAHSGSLFIGWTGVGNLQLNVAQVVLSGGNVSGLKNKVTLGETSPARPALASFNGRLFLAWRGSNNFFLYLNSSTDNGQTFGNKFTSAETSTVSPALAPSDRLLFYGSMGGRALTGNSMSRRQRAHSELVVHCAGAM